MTSVVLPFKKKEPERCRYCGRPFVRMAPRDGLASYCSYEHGAAAQPRHTHRILRATDPKGKA